MGGGERQAEVRPRGPQREGGWSQVQMYCRVTDPDPGNFCINYHFSLKNEKKEKGKIGGKKITDMHLFLILFYQNFIFYQNFYQTRLDMCLRSRE